jgi:UDP-glucose 4-epimerase
MNILITGDSGFIGKHLFDAFKKLVEKTEKDSEDKQINIAVADKVYGLDLTDRETYNKLEKWEDFNGAFDVIYHLAGQTNVQDSIKDPVSDARDNILTMISLIKHYPKAKIIYTNSVASEMITSPYGMSKGVAEQYLKTFHDNYVVCMLPNVYGEGGKGVVDIFKGLEKVGINGDGLQKRTFVHVEDIVEALILAKDWEQGRYYLGGNEPITINDLAELTEKPIVRLGALKGEIKDSVIINTTPNWKPIRNLKEYFN